MLLGKETRSGNLAASCWQPFVGLVEFREFEYSVGPANTLGTHAKARRAKDFKCMATLSTVQTGANSLAFSNEEMEYKATTPLYPQCATTFIFSVCYGQLGMTPCELSQRLS